MDATPSSSCSDVFNLSSLLNDLEIAAVANEDNNNDSSMKLIFNFIRLLMQTIKTEDPTTYNKVKVMMDEEVQTPYANLEEAKNVFLRRLYGIVGDVRWNEAAVTTGFDQSTSIMME